MTEPSHRCPRRGFTLVELLVVIGILAVLIAVLLPVLANARRSGENLKCRAQLKEFGQMFQMYLTTNRQRVPRVNPVPSNPSLVPGAPSIVAVLEPSHRGAVEVFKCPSDRLQGPAAGDVDTYFKREGTSYEYNVFFNAFAFDPVTGVNKTWQDALNDARRNGREADRIQLFNDMGPFHDDPGKPSSRNFLYADWSVDQRRDRPPRPNP